MVLQRKKKKLVHSDILAAILEKFCIYHIIMYLTSFNLKNKSYQIAVL